MPQNRCEAPPVCDLVGEDVTREGLATLRTDVADLRERVADARAAATHLPHRTRYLLIVTDFLERFLDLHDQLVDDVQDELAPEPQQLRDA